jgi:RHS repeat-associated protein
MRQDQHATAINSTGTQSRLRTYLARYYDPSLGRFTQPDTINHLGDLQQGNPYTYAGGDPINNEDPIGQSILEPLESFFLGASAGNAISDFAAGDISQGFLDLNATAFGITVGAACTVTVGAAAPETFGASLAAAGICFTLSEGAQTWLSRR